MKQKIVGIGITGLIGSRVSEILRDSFEFINASSETGVDITDPRTLVEPLEKSNAQIVLLLAAKTDVDSCEKDKELGKEGPAWKINVEGAQNVINSCLKTNKTLIYISTDYVFDGTKENYSEEDQPHPINWYGETKYQAENLVKASNLPWLICRTAYPYRANFEPKNDFVRNIIHKLEDEESLKLMTDHIFTPTFVDDIAYALQILIEKNQTGIFHLTGSQSLSPYEAALIIADIFSLDKNLLGKTTSREYLKDRAPRPLKLALINDKIKGLGANFLPFKQGLEVVKKQMEDR